MSGTSSDGIQFIEASGGVNQTLAFDVSNNSIDAGDDGIGNLNVGGSSTTATVTVRDNDITAGTDGITGLIVESGAQTATVEMVRNTITADRDGIRIEPGPALGTSGGGLVAESNDLRTGGSAIMIDAGPVAGIDIHNNTIAGDAYGVENLNTTDGAAVNATYNYWNASDGPGSAGPYEDPATGALANGSGNAVTNSTATLVNVRFDPYLRAEPGSADVTVRIDSTNSPVTEGETLTVDATVENTGGEAATQAVTLSIGGIRRDAQSVTLAGGETKSLTLTRNTGSGDAGSYTARVASDNDTASRSVLVEEEASVSPSPADFSVDVDSTNAPVTESETLTVIATVDNTGAQRDTQTVTLSTNGTQVDAQSVMLTGGAETTVTLTWNTERGDEGNYTATVASADDASISVDAIPATVTMSNQVAQAGGTLVVVDSDYLSEGGFLTIHSENTTEGAATGPKLDTSTYLSAGPTATSRCVSTTS